VGLRNILYVDLYLQLLHVKRQSLPQNVLTKTTHTFPETDTKTRQEHYIQQGQTKLHHKRTTIKSNLWPHR